MLRSVSHMSKNMLNFWVNGWERQKSHINLPVHMTNKLSEVIHQTFSWANFLSTAGLRMRMHLTSALVEMIALDLVFALKCFCNWICWRIQVWITCSVGSNPDLWYQRLDIIPKHLYSIGFSCSWIKPPDLKFYHFVATTGHAPFPVTTPSASHDTCTWESTVPLEEPLLSLIIQYCHNSLNIFFLLKW